MKTQATQNSNFASDRSMEIVTWIFGLIVLALLLANLNASGMTTKFEDEAYIDDIPFDTEWVVSNMLNTAIDFEEEAYIDDIPFETESIVNKFHYQNAVKQVFEFGEEAYINDIPFSTELVAKIRNLELQTELCVNFQ